MIGHMIRQIMESRGVKWVRRMLKLVYSDFSLKLQSMLTVKRKLLKSATLTETIQKIMATDTDMGMSTNYCRIS